MRSGGDTDTSIAQAHQPNDWQEAERAKIKRLFAIANSLSKLNEIAPITEEDVQTEIAAVRAAKTAER